MWQGQNQLQQQDEGNKKRTQFSLRLPAGCSYYDLYEKRDAANLGQLINTTLQKIEDANRDRLGGVFHILDFDSEILGPVAERNAHLKDLLVVLNDQQLNFSLASNANNVVGEAWDHLFNRVASHNRKGIGDFYTPSGISELLVKL